MNGKQTERREQWRQMIAKQEKSGQSIRVYSQDRGVGEYAFYSWRQRLRKEIPVRGIAIGRNNWVFLGSDCGGKTMAVLRSFVASCELVKVDPFVWFRDFLAYCVLLYSKAR